MSLSKPVFRTFQDWSKDGYHILKGSKATWIEDVPMFSQEQVVKTNEHFVGEADDYVDEAYQEHWDWGIDPGMMVSD